MSARYRRKGVRGDLLSDLVKNARLAWLLFRDKRIPFWLKAIPAATLLYILSPIDFIPGAIPVLGQIDDVGAALLGLMLFIRLCPPSIVNEHLKNLEVAEGETKEVEDYIDATYTVLNDQER
ncbi:MAG: YkvA family protein [Anaerolineae bacterium]